MTDEDYEAIIEELQRQFTAIGLPELGDRASYFREVDGQRMELPRKKLVYEMLLAFDRHLASANHENFVRSLERINANLDGENRLEAVKIVVTSGGEPEGEIIRTIDLADSPHNETFRNRLGILITQIIESSSDDSPQE